MISPDSAVSGQFDFSRVVRVPWTSMSCAWRSEVNRSKSIAGSVRVGGRDTNALSERQLTYLRLRTLGFIFQSFNLVAVLSVFQNVEFPLLLQGGIPAAERRLRVIRLLEQVGLASHAGHR